MSLALLPVFYGLGAALLWGAADFAGGVSSRHANVYRVVLTAEWAGLVVLLPLPFIYQEALPPLLTLVLAAVASAAGTFGLTFLYRALAEGQMSVAAPVSGLLGAVIPMLVSAVTEGFPGYVKTGGFLLALVSIWLVSSGEGLGNTLKLRWKVLRLPVMAALMFGAYFVLMHAASREATFWPLIAARTTGVAVMLAYVLAARQPAAPPSRIWPLAMLGGILDVAANAMYVLAGQSGRLDMAAVLGSLYPGTTVLLAWLLLKEKLKSPQMAGVLSALVAIILIAA